MNERSKDDTVDVGGWRFKRDQIAANAGVDPTDLPDDSKPGRLSDDDMPLGLAINDNPDLRLKIGRHLGGVRKLKKISQEQAAEDLRVSRPHLSNIEQGRSRTGWKALRGMATYYGYGMKALIEEVQALDVSPTPAHLIQEHAQTLKSAPVTPRATSDDEEFILGLWRVLDKRDQQFIAKQILQLAQARVGKIGSL